MSEQPNPTKPHVPTASEQEAASEVATTLRHNKEILEGKLEEATLEASMFAKNIEGKRCFFTPINIYVDSTSGRISRIVAEEDERREAAIKSGLFVERHGIIEPILPAESTEPTDGRIVKIPARSAIALPFLTPLEDPSVIPINRPESWPRNDQLILVQDPEAPGIDALIQDPIERGIFLKSIEEYNQTPQAPQVSALAIA